MSMKKKANDRGCECSHSRHKSKIECEEAQEDAKINTHFQISSKVVCFSKVVTIFVGKEKIAFSIHRDLLTLHSNYFKNLLHNKNKDAEILLSGLKPHHFAEFTFWIYSREILCNQVNYCFASESYLEEIWMLGGFLNAPGFQNYCMTEIIEHAKHAIDDYLRISRVQAIYENTTKGSMPRKFMADLLNWKNPFRALKEGSKDWENWESLLQNQPDLGSDMVKSAWKNWTKSHPWDYELRASYMVKEPSLDESWEKQILANRSKEEILQEAGDISVQTRIEREHIRRNEADE